MEPPSSESDQMEWPGHPTGGVEMAIAAAVDDGGDTGQCYRGERINEPLCPMPLNPSTSTAPSSDDSPTHSCSSSTKTTCGYRRACTEGVALCLSLGEQASDGELPSHRLPSPAVLPTSSGNGKSLRRSREKSEGGSGGRDCNGEFVCNECGLEFTSLRELQLHMVRKTAWSNQGLVGCRVSCLVDNREWHEGVVTQYHKSGKHCVEYRRSGEKRWVNMLRTAFYIVERGQLSGGEVKEMEPDPTEGLAPVEKWTFQEEITLELCMALSLLHRSYGCRLQETGHKTVGHTCVTDEDKVAAREVKGSLLYGELLPRGVNKAMGPKHLNAAKASTVFDLGMGTGKVAMQVFLQFPNLTRVYGVELSRARFALGEAALMALMELQPRVYRIKRHVKGEFISIETLPRPEPSSDAEDNEENSRGSVTGCTELCRGAAGRTLEFACGNLFDVTDVGQADLVLLETDVSSDIHPQLSRFLMGMKKGAQALTYLDLRKMWGNFPFPFRQVEVNRSLADRFPTSWSVNRGHHFFLWSKVMPPSEMASISGDDDEVSSSSTSEHKRDHRQGLPGGSRLKKGNSSLCGDRGLSLRSYSVRSTASARTSGDVENSNVGEDGARSRGRRGHPKLLRFPFLGCLGYGRKSSSPARHPQNFSAANNEVPEPVPVPIPAQNSSRNDIDNNASVSSRNPSLHELFLLDANGGGRSALFAIGDDCNGVGKRGGGVAALKDIDARVGGDACVTPPPLPPRSSAVRSSTKPRKLGR